MRTRTVGVLIILSLTAGGAIWALRNGFLRPAQEVDAAPIRRGTLETVLPVTGVFEVRSVDLSFDIPGRLSQLDVREGNGVLRGALLASLDDAELRALAEQAEAAVDVARRDRERASAAVDAARQQAAQTEAAYHAARANLAQLQAGARRTELQEADAAVEVARSALEQARRNLAIQEQLFRDGAIARAQLDAAQAQYESAEAQYRQAVAQRDALRAGARPEALVVASEQVRQAEAAWQGALANIRQAEALALGARSHEEQALAAARAARARAARAHLRAPFDGIVTRVYLNPGTPVGPAVPVLTLVASSGWVIVDVDEADIGKVTVGQVGRIRADAYPSRQLTGRLTNIGGQVDVRLGSRTVRVRIDLDTAGDMRPGTSVDVDLIISTNPDALLAPLEAVIAGENGLSYVYLIRGGVLRRRQVQTGESNDRLITIRNGVREGDLIAIAEPVQLRDGMRVRLRSRHP